MLIDYCLLICLSHLAPLFDNPKLDRELRSMLRERFPEFCSSPSPPTEGTALAVRFHSGRNGTRNGSVMFVCPAVKMEEAVSMEMDNHVLDKEEGCYDNTEAAFSDDEEEVTNKGEEAVISQITGLVFSSGLKGLKTRMN